MKLSDRDLAARLADGSLVVDPITDPDIQIQPNGIDVRLGTHFKFAEPQDEPVEPDEGHDFIECFDVNNDGVTVRPDDFVLATTKERVEVPPDLTAVLDGRSSVGRIGITVHSTAGRIDAGYEGEITLEISNESPSPVRLYPEMRMGQLVFEQMTSPAERPYGSERGSSYQEQAGATESELGTDPEFSR